MTGPGMPKLASYDWSQMWLAKTPELSPALFRLSGNTGGAFTMLGLYPTVSCTPRCLKEQYRPNSCWSLNFLRLFPHPHDWPWKTEVTVSSCSMWLGEWVVRLHHLTYHYHRYQSVTSANWLLLVSHLRSIKWGRDSMALIDLILCTK